jgi:predicted O-linked N-acetylglucosamine transferase (SPINDLY family)
LNNLGLIAFQQGDFDAAARLFAQAVDLDPSAGVYWRNLASGLRNLGRLADAEGVLRQGIARVPSSGPLHTDLAEVLRVAHRFDEALPLAERALKLAKGDADTRAILAAVLLDLGRFGDSEQHLRAILKQHPDHLQARLNLAVVLQRTKRPEAALAVYDGILARDPGSVAAWMGKGRTLMRLSLPVEASEAFGRAAALDPDAEDPVVMRLRALIAAGRSGDDMLALSERLLARHGASAAAWDVRRATLQVAGRLPEAEQAAIELATLRPTDATPLLYIGHLQSLQGKPAAAESAYRDAMALDPRSAVAHQCLLGHLTYNSSDRARVAEEHRRFGEIHGNVVARLPPPASLDLDPARPLRVGYVSGDFRDHPVGLLVEPYIRNHDRSNFEVFCYCANDVVDVVTQRIMAASRQWRDVAALSDDELAQQIRSDGIDILVDLSGHTARNRLMAFARKPAPIQLTWLGYHATTGLAAIDYALIPTTADRAAEQPYYTEELIPTLGRGAFEPPDDAPDPTPPPCGVDGTVTFGSFNAFTKISAQALAAWARILAALPDARLLMKGNGGEHAPVQSVLRDRFAALGIDGNRIAFEGFSPRREFLARLSAVDIALDPFPFSGGMTTLYTLWMGVPIVALGAAGDRLNAAQRLQTALGLDDLVAHDVDQYVEVAVRLSRQRERLSMLRRTLRSGVMGLGMADTARWTQQLETLYRELWRRFVERSRAASPAQASPPCDAGGIESR